MFLLTFTGFSQCILTRTEYPQVFFLLKCYTQAVGSSVGVVYNIRVNFFTKMRAPELKDEYPKQGHILKGGFSKK